MFLYLYFYVALTAATSLLLDDVPIECAAICGPIVQLSLICASGTTPDLRRRLLEDTNESTRTTTVTVTRTRGQIRPTNVQEQDVAVPSGMVMMTMTMTVEGPAETVIADRLDDKKECLCRERGEFEIKVVMGVCASCIAQMGCSGESL